MSLDRFLNAVKGQSSALDQAQGQPRFGTVASFDPQHYTARVLLQPEGVLSGWLPVLASWIGNGWGMVAPPAPGDQVLVVAQEGQAEHGVIVGRAFSQSTTSPEKLGERADAFEAELRERLGALSPNGAFIEIAEMVALVARRERD